MATPRIDEALGSRIRRLRLAKGLRQQDLAEPVCRSAYVSQIEAGIKSPSGKILEHFARVLEVDVGELISGRPTGVEVDIEIQIQEGKGALYAGDIGRAEELLRSALEQAVTYGGLVRQQARAEEALGTVAERRGDLAMAIDHFERARSLLTGDLPMQADAVAGAARCYHMSGDGKYAVHLLEDYVRQLRKQEAPDPTALMRALSSLSYFYLAAGFADQAVARAEEARALEPRSGNVETIACMNINVARVLLHERREADALRALERAEAVFRQLDWKIELARSLIAQGFAYSQKEDFSSAEVELNRALDILVEAPSKFDEAAALGELGRILRITGDVEGARKRLTSAMELLEEGDLPERALAHRELALAYIGTNDVEAIDNLKHSADLYRAANKPVEVALSLGKLADLYRTLGRPDDALRAYEDAQAALEAFAN